MKRSTCTFVTVRRSLLCDLKQATGEYVNVCYRGKAAEVDDIYWPSGKRIATIAASIPAHIFVSDIFHKLLQLVVSNPQNTLRASLSGTFLQTARFSYATEGALFYLWAAVHRRGQRLPKVLGTNMTVGAT